MGEVCLEEPEIASKLGAERAEDGVGAASGAESVGLGREAGLEDGLEEEEEEFLDDTVLKGGWGIVEGGAELAAGDGAGGGWVGGGADEEMSNGAPEVGAARGGEDGHLEGEEGAEVGEVDGDPGGEGASVVGAGPLVGEDPEVELLKEASEIGKRRGIG